MEYELSGPLRTRFLFLAMYQAIGGIMGLLLAAILLSRLQAFSWYIVTVSFISLLLYGFSIYCGMLMFNQHKQAIRFSIINQFLQLASFSIAGYTYGYVSGICIDAGINLTYAFNWAFSAGFSAWKIGIARGSDVFVININIVALYLIIFIDRMKKKVREEGIEATVSQIGE
ncbi:MAG TPA: hypothetical protein VG738_10510 [Chitinophagaceae bacterium]|nr:hypothetical protein [Chitinophagaceae bacterium]